MLLARREGLDASALFGVASTFFSYSWTGSPLADVCGDPGYEDCGEDCPLPDPMEFNHTALFHALYAAGLLALAVGVLCDTADSWTATEKPTDPAKELERV